MDESATYQVCVYIIINVCVLKTCFMNVFEVIFWYARAIISYVRLRLFFHIYEYMYVCMCIYICISRKRIELCECAWIYHNRVYIPSLIFAKHRKASQMDREIHAYAACSIHAYAACTHAHIGMCVYIHTYVGHA